MRGRPGLVTAYQRDQAIFPTNTQRVWFAIFALIMALLTFVLSDDLALRGASAAAAAVGAIGLNRGRYRLGRTRCVGDHDRYCRTNRCICSAGNRWDRVTAVIRC